MAVDFDAAAAAAIAAFAEPITYTPAGGAPFAIQAIVDAPFVEIADLAGPAVATQRPFVTLRLADFPLGVSPQPNDQLIARDVTYAVREVRPDGQGLVRLPLNAN